MATGTERDADLLSVAAESSSMRTAAGEDSDLLMTVLRHSAMFRELLGESLTREELGRRLDVSRSTCYRYTNRLGELDMVAESGEDVTLTAVGETIATEVVTFEETVTQTLHPADGEEVFVDILRHSPGLQALSRRPLDRREVEDRLGVSDTTGYRITRSLEDRELIEKTDGRYAITSLGEAILGAVSAFESSVRTATGIGPVLPALRESGPSVGLEAFTGATVTTTDGYTFSPQNRHLELLEETDGVRGFNIESVVPSYLGDVQQLVEDGLEAEIIKQPETAAEMLAEFPHRAMKACNNSNVSVYLHDDITYSLSIFDDRIAIGALDADTGTCHTHVDTDATAARAWAEAVYESYKEDAVHLQRFEPFTLQEVVEDMRRETDHRA